MGVIYKLTCKTTGLSYIGQTKHTSKYRWNQHVWESKHPNANQSRKLNNAICKYGSNDFIIEDVLECDECDLDQWEVKYIEEYKTFENGYNLTKGGKSNQDVSQETRDKLSKALKGKPKNVQNNRKREEDNILPKYLKHYVDKEKEGYKISDHPKMNGGSVSFTKSNQTMEEKYNAAMEILKGLDDGTYIHRKKDLPKGITIIPNGYRFRLKGHPVKTFQNSKLTMEDKFKLADEHAKNIIKGMQFND